jgi:hypothetical protein
MLLDEWSDSAIMRALPLYVKQTERFFTGEDLMKKLIITAIFALLSSNLAFADASCDAKAAEKKLAGAAKSSFLKKCEADAAAASPQATSSCEAKAAEKKLAGAAKNSFMKKCEADQSAAPVAKTTDATKACEAKAAEKKLAGAAKNSFVKKCVTDAGK